MAKGNYCDSEALELTWYDYAVARVHPELEPFRERGLVWSRPITEVRSAKKNGVVLHDPYSNDGMEYLVQTSNGLRSYNSGTVDKLINCCNSGKCVRVDVLPVKYTGFRMEAPNRKSWDRLVADVFKICQGISKKFANPNSAKYDDIVSTINLAIINKIKQSKLKFTPGRAPVFSLLTMAIHREIYTILNCDKRNEKLIATAKTRANKTITRSLSRNQAARRAMIPVM